MNKINFHEQSQFFFNKNYYRKQNLFFGTKHIFGQPRMKIGFGTNKFHS